MPNDLEISFDFSTFNQALGLYAENSKKGPKEILEQQAKIVVRKIIAATPPGKIGVKTKDAKKKGEAAVRADINRLFRPVVKARAEYVDLASIHAQYRNSKGRINKGVAKHAVYSSDFNKYLSKQVKRVGILADGWSPAAKELGYRPPAWISRHNSPGSAKVKISKSKISVVMVNRVAHARIDGLERRVQLVLQGQERAIVKQVNKFLRDESPFK